MEVERCYGCSLTLRDLPFKKRGHVRFINVHFTPFSAKHVEDIVAFLAWKVIHTYTSFIINEAEIYFNHSLISRAVCTIVRNWGIKEVSLNIKVLKLNIEIKLLKLMMLFISLHKSSKYTRNTRLSIHKFSCLFVCIQ